MEPDITRHRFVEPRQCLYWEKPELVRGGMKERFELIDTYEDDSHLRRYLLKCRECGQLYFHEFFEWIDWVEGNDPQYVTYIPVSTVEEAAGLAALDQFALQMVSPALYINFPSDAKEPTVFWRGKDVAGA